jgi:hypothetical protein
VNCLVLNPEELWVLVDKKSAPVGTKFVGHLYTSAPGCRMTKIPLAGIVNLLPPLAKSHHAAISVASRRPPHPGIRNAHSTGITKFLSQVLGRPVLDPSYARTGTVHLLNGGIKNGDKALLERVAEKDGHAKLWTVPKSAAIGDEVVINIGGHGLFATGRIASQTKRRTDLKNRYGASLDSVALIVPPISMADVQHHIPDLKWASYPRSIATPSAELSQRILGLVWTRRMGTTSNDTARLDGASPEELTTAASLDLVAATTPGQRLVNQYVRSARVRRDVLKRAEGLCEGCSTPAPFSTVDGSPFLETHHTRRRSEGGPDHVWYVVALCPNCHRRTDFGADAESFNASLIKILDEMKRQS